MMPMLLDIPRDKTFPDGAGQCDGCGGNGCAACNHRGWLPAGSFGIRLCLNPACQKPLAPGHVAVYCSSACAAADA